METGIKGVPVFARLCPDIPNQATHSSELLHELCLGLVKTLLEVFTSADDAPRVAALFRENEKDPFARVLGNNI